MPTKSRSEVSAKKRKFTITVEYFTVHGEFCIQAEFSRMFRTTGITGEKCNMNDVVAHIRGLRDSGGQGALPGECHYYTEGWSGYILVDCVDGWPCLILPR